MCNLFARTQPNMTSQMNANVNDQKASAAHGRHVVRRGAMIFHPVSPVSPVVKAFLFLFQTLPTVTLAAGEKAPADPVGAGGILQVLVALVFVLALIVGLAFLMRRFGAVPQGAGGAIRVLGGVALGQRERAVLVQVGDTQLLVGIAPGAINTLHVLDKPIAVPNAPGRGDNGFAERLAAAMRRGGKP
jgi:flagellar protein FliO/FliZ